MGHISFGVIQSKEMDSVTNINMILLNDNECEIDPVICDQMTDTNSAPQRIKIIGYDKCRNVENFNIFSMTQYTRIPSFILTMFRRLKLLRVNDAGITILDADSFCIDHKLQELDLQHNAITSISSNVFQHLANLTNIDLADNQINRIESGLFENLPALTTLNLSCNALITIDSHTFRGAPNLRHLSIESNQLRSIADDALDLTQLEILSLKDNRLGPQLSNQLFERIPSLEQLDLSGNALNELGNILVNCRRLISLNLSNNLPLNDVSLSKLSQCLPNISYLYLENVRADDLVHIPDTEVNRSLTHLDISNNLLDDEDILINLKHYSGLKTVILDNNKFLNLNGLATLNKHLLRLSQLSVSYNPLDTPEWHTQATILLKNQNIELITSF